MRTEKRLLRLACKSIAMDLGIVRNLQLLDIFARQSMRIYFYSHALICMYQWNSILLLFTSLIAQLLLLHTLYEQHALNKQNKIDIQQLYIHIEMPDKMMSLCAPTLQSSREYILADHQY